MKEKTIGLSEPDTGLADKEIFNNEAIFNRVKDAGVQSLKDFFPIVGKNRQLVLKDIHFNDNLDPDDFNEQERIKLSGGTWGMPIFADLDLIDKTSGQLVDSVSKMKLMTLPKLTNHRFSYIVNGNEYQVVNQLRLKPGIYHRIKANEEIEAQINSARGRNFKIPFNRDTGVFHLKVGTANIKAYPILRDLGVPDEHILKYWGPDILRANQQASAGVAETESQKLYKNLFYHEKAVDRPQAIQGIKDYLNTMTEFDPEVMHYQLGHRHERLDPDVILKSTQKLLKISQGEDEPDDRDSVVVKKLLSVDDFLKEKLHLTKTKNPIFNKLLANVDKKERIREIVKHEYINRPIESFFTQSMLSNAEQQINPLHMLSMVHKLTFHGEGGIQSEQAVTNEARGVHPSHFGFIDPIQTPEGHNIGAVLHTATGLVKDGNELKTRVVDAKTGLPVLINPKTLFDSKIGFPDEYDAKLKPKKDKVRILQSGNFDEVHPNDVDYIITSPKSMFSWSTNMIPFLPSTSGNRALTTSKMQEQALPLLHREAPLVQVKLDENGSYEKALGEGYSFKAPVSGVVSEIKDGVVFIRSGGQVHKVSTYNNFPLNSKHFLHTDLKIKPGDTVTKGQLIGDTNYTKDGQLALGTNLKTAYIPWHGYNYEDGVVISSAAAQKLASQHMHKESVLLDENTKVDRDMFRAHYPGSALEEHYAKLDDQGVVKIGQTVNPGDLLITALKKATPSVEDNIIKNIHKSLVHPWKNHALHWEHETPGEIVKIGRHGKRLDIYIRTVEPAVVGDKIAGRHGNKGIITKILPDGEMPHDNEGEAMDILLNPQGIPSRMNLGTILETTIAKTAHKNGKPFLIENFGPVDDHTAMVRKELAKHGFDPSGAEDLYDPKDGKLLGKITRGHQYIMKLDHSVSKKFNVRTFGSYTSEGIPTRGSDEGGQSVDPLLMYSLLSHGAKRNLYDMAAIKAERNDEFWRALQAGRPLPPPKPTFIFEKFIGLLKALGVDVEKKGNKLLLSPLTDANTLAQSSGPIQNARGLLAKNLLEEPGGLFDPKLTGGMGGSKWAHIDMSEPFPNPIFEDAIKTITGMNEKVYNGLLSGTHSVDGAGKVVEGIPDGNLTGGNAFQALLKNINVSGRLARASQEAIGAPAQKLNKLNKEIRFLGALQKKGLSPDVYLINKLPVLPPKYRPIIPMPDGSLNASDLNLLYKDVFLNNQKLHEAKEFLPEEDLAKIRVGLYQYLSGLAGLTDAPSYRKYTGILDMIRGGSQAKEGLFQAKLVAKRQDLTARSTVVVEPNFGPDEVGIPEEMAKGLYKPFVVRRLVALGYSPLKAEEEMEHGSVIAKNALLQEMEHRPIMLNRAPSLHKFSIIALKPKLVTGHAIKVPPLITAGLGMDFDGDCLWALTKIVIKMGDKLNPAWYTPSIKEAIMPFVKDTELTITGSLLTNIENFPRIESTKIQKSNMDEFDVPKGVFIESFNGKTAELLQVTKFSIHPDCEEVRVSTKNGRQFLSSSDHSLYTLNPDTLSTEKSKPAESIGRLSPISLGIKSAGKLNSLKFITHKGEISDRIKTRELQLNYKTGWFIGAHIGDGWSTLREGSYQLHLAAGTKDNEVLKEWSSFVESLSSYKMSLIENPHEFEGKACHSVKGTYSFSELAEWLKAQAGHLAANKHLPGWVLETSEEFRRGLFIGLLDTDGTANWGNRTGKKKLQFLMNYCTISRDLAEGVCVLARTLGLVPSLTTQTHRNKPAYYITFSTPFVKANLDWLKPVSPHKLAALEKLKSFELNASPVDIVPKPDSIAKQLKSLMSANTTCAKKNGKALPQDKTIYLGLFDKKPYLSRRLALQVKDSIPNTEWQKLPKIWRDWVEDISVGWDLITKAEITGNRTTMYDITVPGTFNFAIADGLIVQDTAAIHIPVTEEAREEAWKMTPTNHLENPGTGKLMLMPSQEAVIGLYLLTRKGKDTDKSYDTFDAAIKAVKDGKIKATDSVTIDGKKTSTGKYMVNELLPKQYRNYDTQFDKKYLTKLMSQIRYTDRGDFGGIVNSLKDLGNLHSTKSGYTLTLDDILTPRVERDKILAGADKLANVVKASDMSKELKDQKLIEIYNGATDKIEDYLKAQSVQNNGLLQSVASGARGEWAQVRQTVMAPMLLRAGDRIVTTPARKSYSEGLTTADYFIQSFGARSGAIDKSKQTSVPGYFAKRLINANLDQTISSEEDENDPGLPTNLDNYNVQDRFSAENIPGIVSRGELIDSNMIGMMKKKGLKEIKIMSPLTSTLPHGVAAKSVGLMPNGKLAALGDNIGVLAAQSMSEPTTQMQMKTFHTGGVAMGGVGSNLSAGMERILQLFEMPEIVKGAGTLALTDGKVEKIEEAPQGGHYVAINGVRHYVPATRIISVKPGDTVEKGKLISDGVVKPQELLHLKGIRAVQDYMVDEVMKTYADQGMNLRRSVVETVIRPLTNLARITDPGDLDDFAPGDYANTALLLQKQKDGSSVKFEPVLKGINTLPSFSNEDWLSQLNFKDLKKVILQGSSKGWSSDIHGTNPIPGYVYGAEFGKGDKVWKY